MIRVSTRRVQSPRVRDSPWISQIATKPRVGAGCGASPGDVALAVMVSGISWAAIDGIGLSRGVHRRFPARVGKVVGAVAPTHAGQPEAPGPTGVPEAQVYRKRPGYPTSQGQSVGASPRRGP